MPLRAGVNDSERDERADQLVEHDLLRERLRRLQRRQQIKAMLRILDFDRWTGRHRNLGQRLTHGRRTCRTRIAFESADERMRAPARITVDRAPPMFPRGRKEPVRFAARARQPMRECIDMTEAAFGRCGCRFLITRQRFERLAEQTSDFGFDQQQLVEKRRRIEFRPDRKLREMRFDARNGFVRFVHLREIERRIEVVIQLMHVRGRRPRQLAGFSEAIRRVAVIAMKVAGHAL